MSTSNFRPSLVAGVSALSLTFFCTIPSFSSIFFVAKKNGWSKAYEDEDGVATEEDTAAFSTRLPKFLITTLSFLSFTVSTAIAVLGSIGPAEDNFSIENWLNAASWFLLLLQASGIALSKVSTQTYELGIYGATSCFVLLVVQFTQDTILFQEKPDIGLAIPFVLRVVQLVLTICTFFANALLPRRPPVFLEGKPVDAAETVSALSKYSFAWCAPLLKLATKKGTLDLEDLPKPDHKIRAEELTKNWNYTNRSGKLWRKIFLTHKWAFILQWMLTLMQAFGSFAPQFVLLHLLRILEKRQMGTSVSSEAWIWVLALGLSTAVASWIESWLFWVSQADLALPVRAELSSLIFRKAMRRKDVKGATKAMNDANNKKGDTLTDGSNNGEESKEALTKQSTINLIGVDARRLGDFCSFNNYFPGSIFKLVISFSFLLTLIGWQSLLAGIGTMIIVFPINFFFSKRYSASQSRLMDIRDEKLGVVTEALQGLRQLKFMSIEQQWQDKILGVRTRELAELWETNKADTMLLFCWIASPILFSATSLTVYAMINGELTPSIAFTAIGVFKQLEVTLAALPELVTDLIDAQVSVNRIESYLSAPEIVPNTTNAPSISFENVSIAWPSDDEKEQVDRRYVLRNINISFPKKELSVISGKTGTGKSLLLAAILGEVDLLKGTINVPKPPSIHNRHDQKATKDNWIIDSSIAFVAQIPWIENASIKDNILFELPFDEERYNKTLEVCALRKDLDMLPDSDATEIGANGVNLSGGQRWRVTFARALYSRAGILILDDLFSALDAHVGRFIFEKALTGELGQGRTRILVTHHVALCKPRTKYLVELGDGTVEHAGLISKLEEDGTLTKIITQETTSTQDEGTTAINPGKNSDEEAIGGALKNIEVKATAKKFVEEEGRERGAVSKTVYLNYFKASGGTLFWTAAIVFFLAQQAITLGRSWWLRLWTGSYEVSVMNIFAHLSQTSLTLSKLDNELTFWLSIYIGMSLTSTVLGTLKFFWIFVGSLRASRKLFERLTFTILRTPLRWVDTVPLGRVLNRFTADFNVIDSRLAIDMSFTITSVLQLVGVIVAGLVVSPYIIISAVLLATVCVHFANRYLAGAREVKRLESNARSPVFEQFGSALTGVATIRSFDNTEVYAKRMYKNQDDWSRTYWYLWLFNRWVGWRMSMLGAIFAVTIAALIISIQGIDAALAGFALAFSLEYTGAVIWTIRHYTDLELDLNSAERIIEYSNLPTESREGTDPPAAWPNEGRLEVRDLIVGYANDLPPVLKGLTFNVRPNERVGIIGRTGAGKSSLTLAIFRFLEAREGSISIDGIDISKIKLHALRSRLAIIPQDPVLFSGTIRSNIDAFDEHTDNELYDALHRVHLVSAPSSRDECAENELANTNATHIGGLTQNKNINQFTSLLSTVTEGGLNLSQGQRQLLCLARAIVSRPKIMVLDEATSAVDILTDALIQRSIREEFMDSTLIVIAHRLSTVCDFDKILVMDDGRAAEFGAPRDLWALEGGIFRGMVMESGERGELVRMITGDDRRGA